MDRCWIGYPILRRVQFSDWRQIVMHLESLAHAQPALFENPFAHIDPDMILLETPVAARRLCRRPFHGDLNAARICVSEIIDRSESAITEPTK